MEQLLSAFLIKNKYCPLPTVGSLKVEQVPAISSITDKVIFAPKQSIVFAEKEMDAAPLLDYIARVSGSSFSGASDALSHYCDRLQEIQPYEKIDLSTLGSFSKDEFGMLQFTPAPALQYFTAPVSAERVIHPDASHDMLVGDKATNTVYMQEMLSTEEKKKWPKWAWAALVLGLAATAIIVFSYLNSDAGNQGSIKAKEAPATYKSGSN
jgi:hypothetical protein